MREPTMTPFEASLERRIRSYAAIQVRDRSSSDTARAVMTARPRRPAGRFGRIPVWVPNARGVRIAVALTLLALAVAASLYVAGSFWRRSIPLELTLTSTSPYPVGGPIVGLGDGRVLFLGSGLEGHSELYDPATGTFLASGSFNEPRASIVTVRLRDGRILAAGGFTPAGGQSHDLASAEVYDPRTGVWTRTGSMGGPHVLCCGVRGTDITLNLAPRAVLLDDGRVLIVGGQSSAADLYDPASGTFSSVAQACQPRGDAIKLHDGRVLVTCLSAEGTQIQFFDPATNAFALGPIPPGASVGHLSLLPDGRVLFAGWARSAERAPAMVYDPDREQFEVLPSEANPPAVDPAYSLSDGRVVFIDRETGVVTLFHPSTLSFERTRLAVPGSPGFLTEMADGRVMFSGDDTRAWIIDPGVEPQ